MLLNIDSYLLLYNAQEHLNDLETEGKSTGNVNVFADGKTHHLPNCKLHNSSKALSPWNPQSSSLKTQPRQQILYQTPSIHMVTLYHPATTWIQMCFTKCVCQLVLSLPAHWGVPALCLWLFQLMELPVVSAMISPGALSHLNQPEVLQINKICYWVKNTKLVPTSDPYLPTHLCVAERSWHSHHLCCSQQVLSWFLEPPFPGMCPSSLEFPAPRAVFAALLRWRLSGICSRLPEPHAAAGCTKQLVSINQE